MNLLFLSFSFFQMCKLVFALFIVSVTIAIIYAQKAEKQTKQDEQSLAAKSAEVTVPKTAQAGNPNKTEVAKKSDKPKPTKRPRRPPRRRRPSRRRRPRRRKRPRNQQRSTKPTAKTVTKKTTNKVPQNTKKDAKVNEQNPGPTPKAPVQVNAAIKQNTPIKTEVNQDNTNKMKQVKTETVAKAENNLNNDVPLNNVMQPSQDIKEEVKQRVINEKSEAKPQVQAMKLAQSQADIPKANTELNSGKPNSDNSHSATGVKTSNEIKHKVEKGQMARKITKVENKPKKQIVSAVDKSMAEQEKFFDFFSFTTTEEPVLAAPPDIDPNKKPGKKVLPTVDPSKGVAHDGIRKLILSSRMDLPTFISRTSRFPILRMLDGIFLFSNFNLIKCKKQSRS